MQFRSTFVALLAAPLMMFASCARAEPFDAFVQSLRAAAPGSVESAARFSERFQEARAHLLRLYDGITVRQSLTDTDGRVFDCIRYDEQPAIRMGIVQTIAPPPPFLPDTEAPEVLPTRSICAAETFPIERITLKAILKAGSLREYFQKSPGREHLPSDKIADEGSVHLYSYGTQTVNSTGSRTDVSLYSPPIDEKAGEVFSLEQHWYAGIDSNNNLQTAEVGWQAFPQMYNTRKSVLFSYYTADGYLSTGCYNYTCGAFVQNPASTVSLGQVFPKYSVRGGKVVSIRIGFTMQPDGWWMSYGNQWVGYYPLSIYGSGQLSQYATVLQWGTESVGATQFPPEGSGAFGGGGSGGPDYAPAYVARMVYRDVSGTWHVPSVTAESPSPSCYSAGTPGQLGRGLGYGFGVGGPGGSGC